MIQTISGAAHSSESDVIEHNLWIKTGLAATLASSGSKTGTL